MNTKDGEEILAILDRIIEREVRKRLNMKDESTVRAIVRDEMRSYGGKRLEPEPALKALTEEVVEKVGTAIPKGQTETWSEREERLEREEFARALDNCPRPITR